MTIKREYLDRREVDFSDVASGRRLPPVQGWIKGLDFPVLVLRQDGYAPRVITVLWPCMPPGAWRACASSTNSSTSSCDPDSISTLSDVPSRSCKYSKLRNISY